MNFPSTLLSSLFGIDVENFQNFKFLPGGCLPFRNKPFDICLNIARYNVCHFFSPFTNGMQNSVAV